MKRYLLTVANRNPTFIVDDLVACGRYFGFSVEFEGASVRPGQAPGTGFIACRLANDEDAVSLANRSISVQSVSRLLGDGATFEEMVAACQGAEHDVNEGSFAVKVQCHNRRITDQMRKGFIADLVEGLKLTAPVNLKSPDRLVLLSLQFNVDGPLEPTHCYASVYMCDGNSTFPDKFNLKKRKHLNTTSMESAIALYSAVQGLVGPGTVAYDPFCGSGSILVAMASLGSYVIGSDLYFPSMFKAVGVRWVSPIVIMVDKVIFARFLEVKKATTAIFSVQGVLPTHGFVEMPADSVLRGCPTIADYDQETCKFFTKPDGKFSVYSVEADIAACNYIAPNRE